MTHEQMEDSIDTLYYLSKSWNRRSSCFRATLSCLRKVEQSEEMSRIEPGFRGHCGDVAEAIENRGALWWGILA